VPPLEPGPQPRRLPATDRPQENSDFVMLINAAIRFFCLALFGLTQSLSIWGRGKQFAGAALIPAHGAAPFCARTFAPSAFEESMRPAKDHEITIRNLSRAVLGARGSENGSVRS
jgi:hypothetical protein